MNFDNHAVSALRNSTHYLQNVIHMTLYIYVTPARSLIPLFFKQDVQLKDSTYEWRMSDIHCCPPSCG